MNCGELTSYPYAALVKGDIPSVIPNTSVRLGEVPTNIEHMHLGPMPTVHQLRFQPVVTRPAQEVAQAEVFPTECRRELEEALREVVAVLPQEAEEEQVQKAVVECIPTFISSVRLILAQGRVRRRHTP